MNSLFIGLGLCILLLPVNITLTFMSFRYPAKSVFTFIGGVMFFNLVTSGVYTYALSYKVENIKQFVLGIGLSIISSMMCKVIMTMRNLHTHDQMKELKKLKAELLELQKQK